MHSWWITNSAEEGQATFRAEGRKDESPQRWWGVGNPAVFGVQIQPLLENVRPVAHQEMGHRLEVRENYTKPGQTIGLVL